MICILMTLTSNVPHLQTVFSLELYRNEAISFYQNGPLNLDKWKVRFLPPLGIEDNAKFSSSFVLKISLSSFSLQDDSFTCYMAQIFKKYFAPIFWCHFEYKIVLTVKKRIKIDIHTVDRWRGESKEHTLSVKCAEFTAKSFIYIQTVSTCQLHTVFQV